MNATPQQPFFSNPVASSPKSPAAETTQAGAAAPAPFPQPARQPQRPGQESGASQPAAPTVHEQPMSAHAAAQLACGTSPSGLPANPPSQGPQCGHAPQEVQAEIIPDAEEPSGSVAKDAACVVGGAAIAAVGVPMLVLPGPGVAAIAGGAALAGKGVKGLAQRVGGKSAEKPVDVEVPADLPHVAENGPAQSPEGSWHGQGTSASFASEGQGVRQPFAQEGQRVPQRPFAQTSQAEGPAPAAPTVDDVKRAAATAGKAALGAFSLAAQAISAKAKGAGGAGNVREDALRTARDLVDKAASSQAAQTAAEATANAARTLADKAEAFARSHRR